jgi:hypothetical protein
LAEIKQIGFYLLHTSRIEILQSKFASTHLVHERN